MHYLGGKSRLGGKIALELRSRRQSLQNVLEPFCGSCWVTQHIYPGAIMASDICEPLIMLHNAVQRGWEPPDFITESEYAELQHAYNDGEISAIMGFVGFACSWGGKWFGGYARGDTNRNYCREAKESLLKRHKFLKKVIFEYRNYKNIDPRGCLIYCDPPYRGTTGYGIDEWDSPTFWEIMRVWSRVNTVIISEYTAPRDFKIIWEHEHFTSVGSGKTTERLFQHAS